MNRKAGIRRPPDHQKSDKWAESFAGGQADVPCFKPDGGRRADEHVPQHFGTCQICPRLCSRQWANSNRNDSEGWLASSPCRKLVFGSDVSEDTVVFTEVEARRKERRVVPNTSPSPLNGRGRSGIGEHHAFWENEARRREHRVFRRKYCALPIGGKHSMVESTRAVRYGRTSKVNATREAR